MKRQDFLIDGSDWQMSLSKLVGKKIADITGHPSNPFGGAPLFSIFRIVFEDGTAVHVGGEHDVAYIESSEKLSNLDEETLQRFIEEDEQRWQ